MAAPFANPNFNELIAQLAPIQHQLDGHKRDDSVPRGQEYMLDEWTHYMRIIKNEKDKTSKTDQVNFLTKLKTDYNGVFELFLAFIEGRGIYDGCIFGRRIRPVYVPYKEEGAP